MGSKKQPLVEKRNRMHAVLVLEDGSVWQGNGFGAVGKTTGEVVFNTGMVGYVQCITDPSYYGQIVCQTYPLIGNYGICKNEFESDGPKISGYVISELCKNPEHYTSERNLEEWLESNGIPGIEGIDTRELTKTLRTKGTMLGLLKTSRKPINVERLLEEVKRVKDPNSRDLISEVTVKEPVTYQQGGKMAVVIDCGAKNGIIRSLLERGIETLRVPAAYQADRIMELDPDAVIISNGPGDPKKAKYVIKTVEKLIQYKIPLMGICLGNQILALALGCDTYKMKFGHRGQNHPVIELETRKCYITSQNHGYAIAPESVEESNVKITFVNANDRTVEGIEHRRLPIMGVQFHPEASPGPLDANFLFDRFIKIMSSANAKG
jgi:carbamoyl-phosphate synthase small subunit